MDSLQMNIKNTDFDIKYTYVRGNNYKLHVYTVI